LPFKTNAARRHHIPKQTHRVTNWAEYDAGLRARGSLTVWFTPEAVAAWKAERRCCMEVAGPAAAPAGWIGQATRTGIVTLVACGLTADGGRSWRNDA
jgi:hypothetical protein